MLHYTQSGNGPHVVMIHGFPNDRTTWHPIMDTLTPHFTITLIDLPGAGLSPQGPLEMTMTYMGKEVLSTIQSLELDNYVLVGHSMGGYTALEVAALSSQGIKGISLVHSLATADNEEKIVARKKSIELILGSEEGKQAFLKGMVKNLFEEKFAASNPAIIQTAIDKGNELTQHDMAAFYHAIMSRSDKNTLIQQLGFPIQWIIGEADKATPKEVALKECQLAGVSEVDIFKEVGHMSMIEAPEKLAAALSRFCHICFT